MFPLPEYPVHPSTWVMNWGPCMKFIQLYQKRGCFYADAFAITGVGSDPQDETRCRVYISDGSGNEYYTSQETAEHFMQRLVEGGFVDVISDSEEEEKEND